MQTAVKFQSELKTFQVGENTIPLENLTPILPPKERERRRRDIEKRLFDVFIKYDKPPTKQARQAIKPNDNIVVRG